MATGRDERSLGDLFSELAHETSTLVRQEVELARAELSEQASHAARPVASLVLGGVIAFAGLLAVVAGVILALAELGLPSWVAALLVGLVLAGIGGLLVLQARSAIKRTDFKPRRTIETLKEDQAWVKEQIS
jgi:uncharacterized membrane protein YqjE